MNILVVLCRNPYAVNDGANYAIRSALAMLAAFADVSVVGYGDEFIVSSIGPYPCLGSLARSNNSALSFARCLVLRKSYMQEKYSSCEAVRNLNSVLDAAPQVSHVWFEQTQSAMILSRLPQLHIEGKKLILRPHNIESKVVGEIAGSNYFKRMALRMEAAALVKAEARIFRAVDFVLPISDLDVSEVRKVCSLDKVHYLPVVPLTTDYKYCIDSNENGDELLFVGAADWGPNFQAIKWMRDALAPYLLKYFPQVSINIVGRGTDQFGALSTTATNIRFLGYVDDIDAFYGRCLAALAPVQSGSGVNIKVIEALSRGVPVLGSKFAARGTRSELFLECENPSDYRRYLDELLNGRFNFIDRVNYAHKFTKEAKDSAQFVLESILRD